MKTQQKYKVLKRLIPSISKLEFVFFVSLLLSSSVGSMVRLYAQNREIFSSFTGEEIYLMISAFLAYGGSFFWMAYKIVRRPPSSTKNTDHASIVLIPAYVMVVFTLINQALLNPQVDSGLLTQIISSIILIRNGALILSAILSKHNKHLRDEIGGLLAPYQINQRESIQVILLGIAASSIVVLSSNWFLSIVIVYSVGELCLKYYRTFRTA